MQDRRWVRHMTRAQAVGCLALITALLSSCAGGSSPRFGGVEDELQPGYEESVEEQRWVEPDEPSQWEIDQAMEEADQRVREELGLGGWSCRLSVTFNDDWHDDVLSATTERNGTAPTCASGTTSSRSGNSWSLRLTTKRTSTQTIDSRALAQRAHANRIVALINFFAQRQEPARREWRTATLDPEHGSSPLASACGQVHCCSGASRRPR